MDDQWNMWGKVGVQRLLSVDGVTTSMPKQEHNIGGQYGRSIFPSPTNLAFNQPVTKRRAAMVTPFSTGIDASVDMPLPMSWNEDLDTELVTAGNQLLGIMDWPLNMEEDEATHTPVSH